MMMMSSLLNSAVLLFLSLILISHDQYKVSGFSVVVNKNVGSISAVSTAATNRIAIPAVMRTTTTTTTTTQCNMFSGSGSGPAGSGGDDAMELQKKFDDPEMQKRLEEQAKALGMSVDEVKLSIAGQARFGKALTEARITGGSTDKVLIERDGNNPSRYLEITISDTTRAAGKDVLSKELVSALKDASKASKKVRDDAQKDMVSFVGEELKKMGAK